MLSKYIINEPIELNKSHEVLVIPALAIITVFCFGYIIMQKQPIAHSQSSESQSSQVSSQQKSTLSPINLAAAPNLPVLERAIYQQPINSTAAPTSPQSTTPTNMLQATTINKRASSTLINGSKTISPAKTNTISTLKALTVTTPKAAVNTVKN